MAEFNLGLDDPNMLARKAPAAPLAGAQGGNRIDPELLSLLMTYGDQLELTDQEKQLAQAHALRGTPMPEGRNAGRIYRAANPLEFLGAGLQQYAGARDEKALKKSTGELRGKIGGNVAGYGRQALKAQGMEMPEDWKLE